MCPFPRDEICKTVLISIKGDSLVFQPQVIPLFVVYCNTQSENIFLMCLQPSSSFRAVCRLVLFFSRPLHRVPDIFHRRNYKITSLKILLNLERVNNWKYLPGTLRQQSRLVCYRQGYIGSTAYQNGMIRWELGKISIRSRKKEHVDDCRERWRWQEEREFSTGCILVQSKKAKRFKNFSAFRGWSPTSYHNLPLQLNNGRK